MRKIIFAMACMVLPGWVMASGGEAHLMSVDIDLANQASLQKGAKTFVNYCLNCHSASFMRYSRMAKDLGLSEEEVQQNMLFTGAKIGEPMTIAMPKEQAKKWFGVVPPDLSVIARARGVDWVYTYLKSFYADPARPFGVNNLVFKDVGMPHVLGELQGIPQAVYGESHEEGAHGKKIVVGSKPGTPGKQTEAEYDQTVRDLVNFIAYMGEPAKLERQKLGVKVLLFLLFFTVLAYLLKKEYWKDVH